MAIEGATENHQLTPTKIKTMFHSFQARSFDLFSDNHVCVSKIVFLLLNVAGSPECSVFKTIDWTNLPEFKYKSVRFRTKCPDFKRNVWSAMCQYGSNGFPIGNQAKSLSLLYSFYHVFVCLMIILHFMWASFRIKWQIIKHVQRPLIEPKIYEF